MGKSRLLSLFSGYAGLTDPAAGNGAGRRTLSAEARLLPTPTATPYGNNQSPSAGAAVRPSIDGIVKLLPTATAKDAARSGGAVGSSNVTFTDATCRQPERWGEYATAIARWETVLGRLAPEPTEPAPRGGQRLSPRFSEWMMGCDDGWITDVPGVTRNMALKLAGNGVVRQQAVEALRFMVARELAWLAVAA